MVEVLAAGVPGAALGPALFACGFGVAALCVDLLARRRLGPRLAAGFALVAVALILLAARVMSWFD